MNINQTLKKLLIDQDGSGMYSGIMFRKNCLSIITKNPSKFLTDFFVHMVKTIESKELLLDLSNELNNTTISIESFGEKHILYFSNIEVSAEDF